MGRVGIMPAQRVARGLNPLLTFHSVAWGMCFHLASGKNIFKFPLCWRELEPTLCPSPICPYAFTHFQFESVPENIKYQYLSSGECRLCFQSESSQRVGSYGKISVCGSWHHRFQISVQLCDDVHGTLVGCFCLQEGMSETVLKRNCASFMHHSFTELSEWKSFS